MDTLDTRIVLQNTYKALLKIDNNSVRIQIQDVYCQIRDCIAHQTGRDPQEVQEHFEELAIKEKYNLK